MLTFSGPVAPVAVANNAPATTTISAGTLTESGLDPRLSNKTVERVHVVIVTKHGNHTVVPLAHEKNGKGYSWISGKVKSQDNGNIFRTALREISEETGINLDGLNHTFESKILVRTTKDGKIIPTIFYLDKEGIFGNLSSYSNTQEKTGWIFYDGDEFIKGLKGYKKALYGLDTNLNNARLYFNDSKIQNKAAEFRLSADNIIAGQLDVDEFRVSKQFDQTLACSKVSTEVLASLDQHVFDCVGVDSHFVDSYNSI